MEILVEGAAVVGGLVVLGIGAFFAFLILALVIATVRGIARAALNAALYIERLVGPPRQTRG